MSEELKPVKCGCGGEARPQQTYNGDWYVVCEKCIMCSGHYHTKSNAISAWNKAMGGVVTYPSTTPNGVYTSGCTTTNTTDPNEDFHPVRDFMVNPERVAKVVTRPFGDIDLHKCNNCQYYVDKSFTYCPGCGARLEWK